MVYTEWEFNADSKTAFVFLLSIILFALDPQKCPKLCAYIPFVINSKIGSPSAKRCRSISVTQSVDLQLTQVEFPRYIIATYLLPHL